MLGDQAHPHWPTFAVAVQGAGMTQPITYCANCAQSALTQAAGKGLSFGPVSVGAPRLTPITPLGPVKRLADGSWQVPVAAAIVNGRSVCLLHLSMPTAVNTG